MVPGSVPAVCASGVSWEKVDRTIELSDRLIRKGGPSDRDPAELVRVSIVLEKASAVEAGCATMGIAANTVAMAYRAELLATQKRMEKTISVQALQGRPLNVVWNMTLVGNIISAWVPYGSLEQIAAANRYIPTYGGYADARDHVWMLGVAPDAQIITMKIFGRGNPFDSDYMVAIEDAIMLGCDAVNLSLGTTAPGAPYTEAFSELMELMV